jgi:3-oxoacyl-[acyl-carrier protein] reductase
VSSVFITGSTRGIGFAIAKAFAEAGWNVAIHGRTDSAVASATSVIGGRAAGYSFDIRQSPDLQSALMDFAKDNDGLDCVIHCAGIMKDAPLGMITTELAEEVMSTNFMSSLNLVQLASRIMSRKKSGSILLFNSVVGLDGASGQSLYSSSKAALTGLVLSAAKELGPKGIRINALAPGVIETDLIQALSDETLHRIKTEIPLKRLGNVDDISPAALFLAGPGGAYITGTTLRIDGGYRP